MKMKRRYFNRIALGMGLSPLLANSGAPIFSSLASRRFDTLRRLKAVKGAAQGLGVHAGLRK
jgi:hypothetical protein